MATEKRLTRSRLKEVEELCSPCKKLKKSNESIKYCVECRESLCTSCVKNHNISLSDSGHIHVLVEDDTPTDNCKDHPKMIGDMYCGTHDTLCCATCVSTNHSTCSDLHNIDETTESALMTRQLPKMTYVADSPFVEIESIPGKNHDDREKTESPKEYMSDQQRTLSSDNKQSFYRIKSIDKVNIRLETQRDKNDVWSMCILDSGDVLLADNTVPGLKMLDHKTYKVELLLSLPAKPNSVCQVNNQEVVVGLSNQTLQFVSVQDEFILTRSIQLDHNCLGIDVVHDQIYVTDGEYGNIFVHDFNGHIVTKIEKEPNGKKIFSWNRFITVSEDGADMYVTDSKKGVCKLNKEGNKIWGHTVPGVTGAYGICKDGKGNLFVTGFESNNVTLVSEDGVYKREIISLQHCEVQPKAVCFDRLNSKLYVSGCNCDEIYVYTLY